MAYFHGALPKADAEALLLEDDGASVSGKFLIRSKKGSNTEFILSVIYKGAATHHTLARDDEGEEFKLNKTPTGATTMDDLVAKYRSKQPKWPVPLTTVVNNPDADSDGGGGGGGGGGGDLDSPYFHGGIKKGAADALLTADDGLSNAGKFLVRSKGESTTDFILSVIYKGAATHHVLTRPGEGEMFALNKQPTDATTLANVIENYRSKRPKWPVPLTDGVPNGDAAAAPAAAAPAPAAAAPAPAAAAPAPPAASGGGGGDLDSPYFHGGIKKGAADALLTADDGASNAGKFLIRSKGESTTDFILSVIYKGAATHHVLTRPGEGEMFALNKQPTDATTLANVIENYRSKRPKWPVPLTDGVPNGDAAAAPAAAAPAPVAVAVAVAAAPAAAAPAPAAASGGGGGDLDSPYFHGGIKKGAADALLTADDGASNAGKFLIRSKGESTTDFILSVIYKGAATHHVLTRPGEGEMFALNKQPTDATTLANVIENYRSKRPKWPVPLTDGVPNGDAAAAPAAAAPAPAAAAPAPAVAAPAPAPAAAPALAPGESLYFHGGIKKAAADALLSANGGLETKGKFLIRSKGDSTTDFILSIVYKGAATHHQLARPGEGEMFTLNKQPTDATTLADLVENYRTKRPKWPVPLTEGVPNPKLEAKVAAAAAAPTPVAAAPTPTTPAAVAAQPAPALVPEPEPARVEEQKSRLFGKPSEIWGASTGGNGGGGGAAALDEELPRAVDHEMSEYYHGEVSRSAAEGMLAGSAEGNFLFRDGSQGDAITADYMLSIFAGGRVTHHVLQIQGGEFRLANLACSGARNLQAVFEWASQTHAGWTNKLQGGMKGFQCMDEEELLIYEDKRAAQKKAAAAASTSPRGRGGFNAARRTSRAALVEDAEAVRRMQDRQKQHEREIREQTEREAEVRAARSRATQEATVQASSPRAAQVAAQAAQLRQQQEILLAELPDISHLASYTNAEISEDSSSDEEEDTPAPPPRTGPPPAAGSSLASLPSSAVSAAPTATIAEEPGSAELDPDSYMHGNIKKLEADGLLTEAGLVHGSFLVRDGADKESFVLSIVQTGIISHHEVKPDAASGKLIISAQQSDSADIYQLVATLRNDRPDWWPFRLVDPMEPLAGKAGRKEAKKLKKRQSIRERKTVQQAKSDSKSGNLAETSFGAAGGSKRESKKKKKQKKKKLSKKEETKLVLQLKADSARLLSEVAPVVRKWENVELGYVTSDDEDDANNTGGADTTEEVHDGPVLNGEPVSDFLHPQATKASADTLLRQEETKGRFLLRYRTPGDTRGIIVSVSYKGLPTHHLLIRDKIGAVFRLNRQTLPVTTLPALVRHLQEKRTYWPVKLTVGIPSELAQQMIANRNKGVLAEKAAKAAEQLEKVELREQYRMQREENRPALRAMLEERLQAALESVLQPLHKALEHTREGAPAKLANFRIEELAKAFEQFKQAEAGYVANQDRAKRIDERRKSLSPDAGAKNPAAATSLFTQVKWKRGGALAAAAAKASPAGGNGDGDDESDDDSAGPKLAIAKWKKPSPGGAVLATVAAAAVNLAEEVQTVVELAPVAQETGETPFFHGGIKKGEADKLLSADGGLETKGKFLIRSKGDSTTDFILSIVYKGAATHHALVRDGEGSEFKLNKQPTGTTTHAELIEKYRSKQPKWPVPLTEGVTNPNAASAIIAASKALSAAPHAPAAPAAVPAPAVAAPAPAAASGGGGGDLDSPYFHGGIKKGAADALLTADDGASNAGKFLIRSKGESTTDFILSVIYKGAATHHVLTRPGEGEMFALNKQPTDATTLANVIENYRSKRPKWPVPLTDGVPNGDAAAAPAAAAPAPVAVAVAAAPAPAAAAPAPAAASGGGGGDLDSPYFHGGIKKGAADALLTADDGASNAGKFLIRSKGESTTDFILSVIYKGAATHHVLTRPGEGEMFALNKQPTDATTLANVIENYRSKRPKWPVPLTDGVPNGDAAAAPAAPAAAAAAPAASSGGGSGDLDSPFFHGPIKKAAADALLSADGGLDVKGKFLIRSKGASTTEFILSVVYKGAGTHHVLARPAEGEMFTLNKQPTDATTLADLVENYRSKRPKWPVPLTEGVTV